MLAVRGRDSYEFLADVNFLDTERVFVSYITFWGFAKLGFIIPNVHISTNVN